MTDSNLFSDDGRHWTLNPDDQVLGIGRFNEGSDLDSFVLRNKWDLGVVPRNENGGLNLMTVHSWGSDLGGWTIERRGTIFGIGDFNGRKLGNLRAERVNLEVGLGNMDMDFTGDVIEDSDISAEVGLGSLDILLPEEVNGYVDVNKSFLSSVSLPPGFTSERTPGRKTVQIRIDVGVGSVDVRQR